MAKIDYWATPPLNRSQTVLFAPTLEDCIDEDHSVRLLDEVLSAMDWTKWEAHFPFRHGQPPIHPRKMAGAILYGWTVRLKSGRQLEYAARNNLDFIWLLEGLTPDHSTFCKFRATFKDELKDLFKQVVRYAMNLGMVKLNQVGFDGTAVKANSSRYRTWKAEQIERALAALDQQIEELMREADQADAQDASLLGTSSDELPEELKDLHQRRDKLRAVSDSLEELAEAKRREGSKSKAQIPKADPDSRVLLNKEGGYAANYTPLNAVDREFGLIVQTEVIQGNSESVNTLTAMDSIQDAYGRYPDEVLADTAFSTGPNLGGMEEREIDFYSPVSAVSAEQNPANREDPKQPVAETKRDDLPFRDKKKTQFDKSAFLYVEEEDTYYCPMGEPMRREKAKGAYRSGQYIRSRVYRCHACDGCPLRSKCVSPKSKCRTITRDEYEPHRQRMAAKMATDQGREKYNQRTWIAETPFAILKSIFGVRQFLTRGLENVDNEWRWACTAFNLKKIIRQTAQLRAVATKIG